MKILTVVFLLVGPFFGGLALTQSAVAAPERPELIPCPTTPYRSEVIPLSGSGWEYGYQVLWCVDNGRVDWVVPLVTHAEPTGSGCTWKGSREDSVEPIEDSENWTVFNMSEYLCRKDTGTVLVHPWAIVGIALDGRSWHVDSNVQVN